MSFKTQKKQKKKIQPWSAIDANAVGIHESLRHHAHGVNLLFARTACRLISMSSIVELVNFIVG